MRERLLGAYLARFGSDITTQRTDRMQTALREIVNPPKPDEPLGLGAVVRDTKGDLWVRTCGEAVGPNYECWKRQESISRHPWSTLDVAADCVLSEGVTHE